MSICNADAQGLTKEGDDVRRFYPLRLQFDHLISFPAALTVRHVIDETSPLHGVTAQNPKLTDSRMLASIVCIDPVIQAPVQTQTEYVCEQITWTGNSLRSMWKTHAAVTPLIYSKFDDTVELAGEK
ncbi:MAG: hypothetical protein C5B58_01910 [Acidobacteria bacterium]|nr:MAG: hypothetical protein C5B58_01910 [Acidobacteriota bacterium]